MFQIKAVLIRIDVQHTAQSKLTVAVKPGPMPAALNPAVYLTVTDEPHSTQGYHFGRSIIQGNLDPRSIQADQGTVAHQKRGVFDFYRNLLSRGDESIPSLIIRADVSEQVTTDILIGNSRVIEKPGSFPVKPDVIAASRFLAAARRQANTRLLRLIFHSS